jgi:two-component system osmolarity sensor histidine kinase EnvZ
MGKEPGTRTGVTALLKQGEALLRRIMPRTLLGRSLVIIITPLILLQVISTYIFYERHWENVSWRLSAVLAGDIATIIDSLALHPGGADEAAIIEMAGRNMEIRVRLRHGARLPTDVPPLGNSRLEQTLARALDAYVNKPYVITRRPEQSEVDIRIQLADGVLDVVTARKRLFSYTTYIFVLWMVGSSLVLFAVAMMFMRNQIRPVRRLAEAAESFGKGLDVPDFKPEGGAEVRMAAAAFKVMRARIERQMTQRTEMLAGVSHDLGTVLTRMKLALALLGESPETAALNADVADMEKMVEGYLAFARGEGAEAVEDTDLCVLVEEAVGSVQRGKARIERDLPAGLRMPLRPQSLKRALVNLLSNAARYGRTVTVAAAKRNGAAVITIDDDGPGIPEDQLEAVFKPFYRLDPSRNLQTGGTGLGLAIARDAVRRHGGDLTLSRSPMGGLRATLRLPL